MKPDPFFLFHSPAGVSYYYVRFQQDDGEVAWSSPMWVHYRK